MCVCCLTYFNSIQHQLGVAQITCTLLSFPTIERHPAASQRFISQKLMCDDLFASTCSSFFKNVSWLGPAGRGDRACIESQHHIELL